MACLPSWGISSGCPSRSRSTSGTGCALGPAERTYLGRAGASLGAGAVAGREVWDRQHKFRIHLGPLTPDQYERFLPGGQLLRKLVDWVRFYVGFELEWDVRLCLRTRKCRLWCSERAAASAGPRGSAALTRRLKRPTSACRPKRSLVGEPT